MNYKFINVLVFAAGAAIGSAVTWKFLKTKYERIAQQEIDSVKAAFSDMSAMRQDNSADDQSKESKQIDWDELEDLDEDNEAEDESDADRFAEYEHIVRKYYNKEQEGGSDAMAENVVDEPYVIAPLEFGELDGYRTIELTYYADDILEDAEYEIVNNRDELLGRKALMTFGEYEDDAVFVRNERLRTDFQILKDHRTYSEARHIGPDQVHNE